MAGQVRIAADGGISRVTLSHAGKLNAMSRAMWRELRSVFEGIQQDASIRCVIVEGEGGHFCAGGDIAEYPAFRFSEQGLRDFHEDDVWGGLDAMLCCDVPLVAQIEGNCMGAGVEIASCCDIRVAGASAKFGAPLACIGFPMAPREATLVSEAAHRRAGPAGRAPEQTDVSNLESAESQRLWVIGCYGICSQLRLCLCRQRGAPRGHCRFSGQAQARFLNPQPDRT